MKIDFQHFKMPTGISGKQTVTGDARESVADMVYKYLTGVKAHDLAFRIYRSEGDVELTDEELRMVVSVAKTYGTPAFMDALERAMKGKECEE